MIGILVASHSRDAAKGIKDIAAGMSGGADFVVSVGGTEDGGLGNSVPAVYEALSELLSRCDGVVMLPDLGSAVLCCRSAVEMLNASDAARVAIADAPVLEGAMMAAVEASVGSPLTKVVETAEGARNFQKLKD